MHAYVRLLFKDADAFIGKALPDAPSRGEPNQASAHHDDLFTHVVII
jgi:hypothetical protein